MIEVKLSEKATLVFDFDKNNEEAPVTIGLQRATAKKMEVLAKVTGAETQAITSNILNAKNKLIKACSILAKRKELSESGLSV